MVGRLNAEPLKGATATARKCLQYSTPHRRGRRKPPPQQGKRALNRRGYAPAGPGRQRGYSGQIFVAEPGVEFSISRSFPAIFLVASGTLRDYLKSGGPPKQSFPRRLESTTHPIYLSADGLLESIAGFEIASVRTITTVKTRHRAWQEESGRAIASCFSSSAGWSGGAYIGDLQGYFSFSLPFPVNYRHSGLAAGPGWSLERGRHAGMSGGL